MNARTYWQRLRAVGWLAYVPAVQHAKLREQLESNLAQENPWDAHAALAHTAFEDDPPEDVLRGLAECSRGVFTPENIAAKSTTISFKHGGKKYSAKVPETGEWAGTDVIDLANQALADSNIPERFIILPDTADFVCVVFVPTDIYLKAQQANLIPGSKLRVDVCAVKRAEAEKVAGLKKIPARLDSVYIWDMSMELLLELLQMMSGKSKIKLRPLFADPSVGKTVYEVPLDVTDGIAKLPENDIGEIAEKWRDLAGMDKSYFDDMFLELLWDRIHRTSEAAQKVGDESKVLLIFLKCV